MMRAGMSFKYLIAEIKMGRTWAAFSVLSRKERVAPHRKSSLTSLGHMPRAMASSSDWRSAISLGLQRPFDCRRTLFVAP